MDTGTHFVMGITLGGLALADPYFSSQPYFAEVIVLTTIIGSQIPDVDTVLKLRNNAHYITHHRGITHSIPALLSWPLIISFIIWLLLPEMSFTKLWFWSQVAVGIHIFVDIFNAYGTQALRPFTKKWLALGVIYTFDPIIFSIHTLAILLWFIGMNGLFVCSLAYIIMMFYYIYRFHMRNEVLRAVKKEIDDIEDILISPSVKLNQWHLSIITKNEYIVGKSINKTLRFFDRYNKNPIPKERIFDIALKDHNVEAFLSFSPVYRWEKKEHETYTEVRFIDLRYYYNNHYPFVAVCHIDNEETIVRSYTGWIFTETKLQQKLSLAKK